MTMPPGASIAVIGITDRSFAQPLILLRAHVPDDPGYFGERLQSARSQIQKAWRATTARFEPRFEYTDVLGSLIVAGQIFYAQKGSEKVLIILSDMRHRTRDLDLESSANIVTGSRTPIVRETPVATLKDVQVYALGVDGANKDFAYWKALQEFWKAYFQEAGAHLNAYSVLRDSPELFAK